ncbi:6-phosphogluconate dehydrogenase C-terminal domain-like protein [Dichomitus squalens LYAD-421 SS1]|uniref:6-phosphogluconate dehydrogenase, decarboxylating n=1 Tax=Dichomitus squalens (strain LYAD-421) TaxID=732165 RepID=R7SP22_DICSQ|nr:6-phosphogluconate dehydrogenase C-terminal domain-like protein [Dichomitus squalens LYAD-421 SS1]EJF57846.1 6-phosphogluconate dehydrogenase C-terminal domain-like protein [Dichomitus squalens LYAD-421 SS1]
MSQPFDKLGIVGAGSMGSCMTMLFAENDLQVSVYDVSGQNIDNLYNALQEGLDKELHHRVARFKDLDQFMESLGGQNADKLLVFSIPHGSAADKVIADVHEHLSHGDIILDGGNEWYENAERRQKQLAPEGIAYLCMGVSGGYQSARRGPSISPSGDKAALDRVMPLLEKIAAKDPKTGQPCVANLGPAGCGHYVKMVHNGIEQGILGIVSETWELLYKCLHTDLGTISQIFKKWEDGGELRRNFLVGIGADICRRYKEDRPGHVVNEVQDKVVQDADDSEGTGVWSVMEAAKRHVSAPTIAAAHFFRIASADRAERMQVVEALGQSIGAARKQHVEDKFKTEFFEDLRLAVYCACLASFTQGLNLIARASADEGWNVSLASCIRIWREGCIIRSEYIADLLQPLLEKEPGTKNILTLQPVADEITRTIPHLRKVVQYGLEWNAHVPTLSASYEFFKYCGGKHLPSQFMEAELDYFGAHSYDLKSDGDGEVKKGEHHFEWKPA